MCDDYEKARVLDLCEAMPPVYVATDDDDPAFVAHLKSRGCFLSSDLKLGAPRHTLTDVDLLMVDVMLVAGAEVSLTFGHTALARLYDRMRAARGTPRSINVAADAGRSKGVRTRARGRGRERRRRRVVGRREGYALRRGDGNRRGDDGGGETDKDAKIEPTSGDRVAGAERRSRSAGRAAIASRVDDALRTP